MSGRDTSGCWLHAWDLILFYYWSLLFSTRREFMLVKQQQVAMKLQKMGSPGADVSAWWVVTSLVLQARASLHGDAPSGETLAVLLRYSLAILCK